MVKASLSRVIRAGILLSVLTACGSEEKSQVSFSPPAKDKLLIIHAGFLSCGKDSQEYENSPRVSWMWRHLGKILNQFKNDPKTKDQNIDWIITCYGKSRTLSLLSSSNHFETLAASIDPKWEINEKEVLRLRNVQYLELLSSRITAETELTVIGFSYGGWLAMKSINEVPQISKVHALVTIDPISQRHCQVLNPFGCTKPPQDLDGNVIADKTEHWINHFQTQTNLLHSGPISEADSNKEHLTSHPNMEFHSALWAKKIPQIVRWLSR